MLPLGLGREAFFLYFLLALFLILSPVYLRISELALLADPAIVDSQAEILVRLANRDRAASGLPELRVNSKLIRAASFKVDDMFAKQYFAHFSPIDNASPWDFFRAANYRYYAAGENLAVDFVTAEDVHTALMNSPTHRANIMSPLFTEVGISVKQGIWNNHSSIMIAQYFGKERVSAPVVAQVAPTPPASAPAPTPVIPAPIPAPIAAVPPPAPQPSQILGTEESSVPPAVTKPTPLPTPIPIAPTNGSNAVRQFLTAENEIKVFSLFAILSILISFMFLLTRGERLTVSVAARILVLIVMFGYIAAFGVGEFSMSAISPVPAAQIVGSM